MPAKPSLRRSPDLPAPEPPTAEGGIVFRDAVEEDVDEIRALFQSAYGDEYAFPQFFDSHFLKKQVFSDDCLMLVAEELGTRRILGTGSVVFDVGAFTDQLGEFGRLVVHPDGRGRGIGKRLMEERLARVGKHLCVGLADNRVEHPFSQKISLRHGFAPVGYLPIHNGEPVALFARYFNDALALRRNHPHVAAPLHWLADTALQNVGLASDAIIDESASSYPAEDGFELVDMTSGGYGSVLRFEQGRLRNREIFGPVKLHFGSRALERHNTRYLLAKRRGQFTGAIAYARDANIDNAVRIFELIYRDEKPVRFLLTQLDRLCREEWGVDYLETDVSADAPRMQKTLLELGFQPVAYVPSAVFDSVERLDTVRMARYYVPVSDASAMLVGAMKPIAESVVRRFNQQWIEPALAESLPHTAVFAGLDAEQTACLANLFRDIHFDGDQWIAREGQPDGKAYVLLRGRAEIVVGGRDSTDIIESGEFIGELSMLDHAPHSAGVRARGPVEAAVIEHRDLDDLLRVRRDIGYLLYRNLAKGLGSKLKRMTAAAEGAV